MIYDVLEFHKALSHPIGKKPALLTKERMEIRQKWTREELEEVDKAFAEGDLSKISDGIGDAIYFLLGTAVEMGFTNIFDGIWAYIQNSNMSKLNHPHIEGCISEHEERCSCGAVTYNELGKVMKPEGWKPPDEKIKQLIDQEIMKVKMRGKKE